MPRGLLPSLLASACLPLGPSACAVAGWLTRWITLIQTFAHNSIELACTRLACMDGARRCWLCWRPQSAAASGGPKFGSLSTPVELLVRADLPGKAGL